jgi:hypothetical protein
LLAECRRQRLCAPREEVERLIRRAAVLSISNFPHPLLVSRGKIPIGTNNDSAK